MGLAEAVEMAIPQGVFLFLARQMGMAAILLIATSAKLAEAEAEPTEMVAMQRQTSPPLAHHKVLMAETVAPVFRLVHKVTAVAVAVAEFTLQYQPHQALS